MARTREIIVLRQISVIDMGLLDARNKSREEKGTRTDLDNGESHSLTR